MKRSRIGFAVGCLFLASSPLRAEDDGRFRREVEPILKAHCYECHSHAAGKAKGGLTLDSRSGWAVGGDSGPAVAPGKVGESRLIEAVRYGDELKMPPKGKLPAEAIAALERWVAEGAVDPRVATPAPATAKEGADPAAAARSHWAFQPVRPTPPPKVKDESWPRSDVDRFILAALEAKGLKPSPDADSHAWLRRVSLDLTGLPPTPEEISAYVKDAAPGADARVVDRMLGSRAFGERWARHWLDLVGYADQIGTANDVFAEHAWRYRDYVIDAFRTDKPFDRFVREQIAGDLLPADSPRAKAEATVATGFLLLGDLTIVEADKEKLRVDVVDQQVDKIGRAFLGMTLGCARCHDHKFDPIPQRDYYAVAGFLHGTASIRRAEWGVWSMPAEAELPETDVERAERLVRAERHRRRIEALKADRAKLQAAKSEVDKVLDDKTKEKEVAEPARGALAKARAEFADRIRKLDSEIGHAAFFAPKPPRAFAVRDVEKPEDMRITIRGNPHALGDAVPRGFVEAAAGSAKPAPKPKGSGRRELADWIVDPSNPLTARVTVNRIWQKLFGEGIVRSVDYFGLPGERPTHPELLDHLARRFVERGWSQRALIRDLVLSRTYRQSAAAFDPAAAKLDPDNRLLWRMNRVRLDAEAARDAILLVSGRLIPSTGGPALPLEFVENTGGLGPKEVNPPFFRLNRFRPEQEFERTIYLPIIRSGPQSGPGEIRNVFDFTQPAEFAGKRAVTSVPTQALFLMNAAFVKDRARDLAARVLETPGDVPARLARLWLVALGRPIESDEAADAAAFLREPKDAPELARWSELCHALLAGNEFLTRL